ncbi:hypothetical protein GCM10023191_065020 [Actinoallomurus oryzae]|uniref:Histidine kinase/HSP90-like ATPase domain-containing protein n=1 Tax=Actinoallomurus oryzae TaxID=502180 RepID=A0ABP8QN82_9ACTN
MKDVSELNCLRLAALPSAVSTARRHAEFLLARWGMASLADTTALIVSGLVTNAVKAVGVVDEAPSWSDLRERLTTICLCLYCCPSGVVVEVWDSESRPPKRKEADERDESGCGIQLVEALSKQWGYRWPKTGGKWVWCELTIQDARSLSSITDSGGELLDERLILTIPKEDVCTN